MPNSPEIPKHDLEKVTALANIALVSQLADIFKKRGFALFMIGGTIRDTFLDIKHYDYDFATDASPEEVKTMLSGWAEAIWLTGQKFGTIAAQKDHHKIEITTFRKETYDASHRKPDVSFSSDVDVDLSRRDFTINTMSLKLPEGVFYDPFNGYGDLCMRVLNTPLSAEVSFSDDPLRMLRALRFIAYFNLEPSPEILDAISKMKERMEIVSKERIKTEFEKLVLGPFAEKSLLLLIDTGLAEYVFPEILTLAAVEDPEHLHKDLLSHTLSVFENVEKYWSDRPGGEPDFDTKLKLKLAALFHDIGKPATKSVDGTGVHFHKHELVSAKIADKRLNGLRFPKKLIAEVKDLVLMHMRFHSYKLGWTDKAIRKYVRDAGEQLDELNVLIKADCTSQNPRRSAEAAENMIELMGRITVLEAEEESRKIRPAIDGNEIMEFLGLRPGPEVGKILKYLLEQRLEGNITTKEEAYAAIKIMDLSSLEP